MVGRLSSSIGLPRRTIAYLFLILILLTGFGVRMFSLDAQSLWRDEVDAMCYAYDYPRALITAIDPSWEPAAVPPSACPPTPITASPEGTLNLTQALAKMVKQNGPLYFFILRLWIEPAGTSVTAMRFFSLWFGVLAIPLTYVLARRLLGKITAIFAMILVTFSPYLVWYSQEVKMYTLVSALALLAIYALRRAVEEGNTYWWAVQVAATSLALYTHIFSAFLIPVQIILFFLWWSRSKKHWLGGLISFGLLTLPYLPLFIWQARYIFVPRETGFPHYTLSEMTLTLIKRWSTGISDVNWGWGGILLGSAVLLGSTSILLKRRSSQLPWSGLGLVAWVTLPLVGIWFISQWQPLFTDRYLIWSAPAIYLLAGSGISLLWEHGRWPALPLLMGILVIFGGNLRLQATLPLKSEFRSAAAFVEEHYEEGDLIIFQIPHGRYTFDYYYSSGDYEWRDGLYTNHVDETGAYQISEGEAAAHMSAITWQYERIWLVATEMGMWDQRGLVQAWLDTHGARVREEVFTPFVEVFLYDLTESPQDSSPGS